MTQQPQEPPEPTGRLGGWLTAVKGLTITNAVVIIMLAIVVVPGYLVYKAVNDQRLLDRFLSDYQVISSQMVSCTLRSARQRGESAEYFISTGFAFEGGDRWAVGVSLDRQPTPDELGSYCAVLNLVVDYMRDPDNKESPTVPGTDRPLIWQYKSGGGSRDRDENSP